jgi:dethiobiotin synthetase
MQDLVKSLDLPLLIVARPDLGTINHTLLTIEAAKNKNINIVGIVISGYPLETADIAIKNAPDMIKELSGEKILGILPKIEDLDNNPDVLKDMVLKHINLDFIKQKNT